MGVFEHCFPLGLGTSRFPVRGPEDTKGMEQSIELVCRALEAGMNYIDTSYTYSAGMAQTVLREAFRQTKRPFDVTLKVMHDMDKTADDARRRGELQLRAMGLERAGFFNCWTIFTYEIFQDIMRKGGVYEGALRLKDEGLIDHICFSTHAPPADIIKILESGAFEGMTLSFSLLNATQMLPVLDAAHRNHVDVAVMNPLGGGVIPQNQEFFSFARGSGDRDVVTAAMRFAKAHPAVKLVLSGISATHEIQRNLSAFVEPDPEPDARRMDRVMKHVRGLSDFCTGCDYCAGCPRGIPISEIMRKRNALLFQSEETYNRTEPELVKNIKLFYAHVSANEWFPDTPENPCIRCGRCEQKCTQRLRIMDAVEDTYQRAGRVGYSLKAHRERLEELLAGKGYRRVGLYPNGGFANLIVEHYHQFFGEPEFEWMQFNSDPKMWGEMSGGLPVHAPDEIASAKPDVIVVCTYKYDREIHESLQKYEDRGIRIVKLHREGDVPWIF